MDGLRTFETVRFKNISYDICMRLYVYIYIYLFIYLYFFIYMIPWKEQGTPWTNKNPGLSTEKILFDSLVFTFRTNSCCSGANGSHPDLWFWKKTWYHIKPIKIRPSMFDSYLNRWVWLRLSPLPRKLPGAGTSYWSPQHRLLSLLAPGIINHYGPNMIDGGTIYINRLSS